MSEYGSDRMEDDILLCRLNARQDVRICHIIYIHIQYMYIAYYIYLYTDFMCIYIYIRLYHHVKSYTVSVCISQTKWQNKCQ